MVETARFGDSAGDPVVLTRQQIKKRWASALNNLARVGISIEEVRSAYELTGNEGLAEAVGVFEDGIKALFLAMQTFRRCI